MKKTVSKTEKERIIDSIIELLKKINIKYKNIDHYFLAFVHRSFVNEKWYLSTVHNERLEFLWDAVLELVVTKNLYQDYPETDEWELTDIRSSLVRWRNLALVARTLNFQDYLLLGKWEELTGWRDNNYLLANCLEAFIWALYIDLWITKSQWFIDKYLYVTLEDILKHHLHKDFKSLLQEYAQAEKNITPSYDVLEETWPDHNKYFEVWVYLESTQIGKWGWASKKKAQEEAAKQAYENRDKWKIN